LQDKKTYYIANKERTLDYGKRYYTEHKDSHAERNRQYRVSHVEETKTYQREYRKTHTNRLKQYHSEYRKTTKFKESIKAYRKLRPELVAQSKAKRRALELNADGSYTALELKAVLISQHCKCVYCDADLTIEFHADHIIPLSKGGTNYISNIQCLCPYHNRNKSDKDPVVYEESIGFART
jgi:5-methylcytosine-specific restriction endonuclease McrA